MLLGDPQPKMGKWQKFVLTMRDPARLPSKTVTPGYDNNNTHGHPHDMHHSRRDSGVDFGDTYERPHGGYGHEMSGALHSPAPSIRSRRNSMSDHSYHGKRRSMSDSSVYSRRASMSDEDQSGHSRMLVRPHSPVSPLFDDSRVVENVPGAAVASPTTVVNKIVNINNGQGGSGSGYPPSSLRPGNPPRSGPPGTLVNNIEINNDGHGGSGPDPPYFPQYPRDRPPPPSPGPGSSGTHFHNNIEINNNGSQGEVDWHSADLQRSATSYAQPRPKPRTRIQRRVLDNIAPPSPPVQPPIHQYIRPQRAQIEHVDYAQAYVQPEPRIIERKVVNNFHSHPPDYAHNEQPAYDHAPAHVQYPQPRVEREIVHHYYTPQPAYVQEEEPSYAPQSSVPAKSRWRLRGRRQPAAAEYPTHHCYPEESSDSEYPQEFDEPNMPAHYHEPTYSYSNRDAHHADTMHDHDEVKELKKQLKKVGKAHAKLAGREPERRRLKKEAVARKAAEEQMAYQAELERRDPKAQHSAEVHHSTPTQHAAHDELKNMVVPETSKAAVESHAPAHSTADPHKLEQVKLAAHTPGLGAHSAQMTTSKVDSIGGIKTGSHKPERANTHSASTGTAQHTTPKADHTGGTNGLPQSLRAGTKEGDELHLPGQGSAKSGPDLSAWSKPGQAGKANGSAYTAYNPANIQASSSMQRSQSANPTKSEQRRPLSFEPIVPPVPGKSDATAGAQSIPRKAIGTPTTPSNAASNSSAPPNRSNTSAAGSAGAPPVPPKDAKPSQDLSTSTTSLSKSQSSAPGSTTAPPLPALPPIPPKKAATDLVTTAKSGSLDKSSVSPAQQSSKAHATKALLPPEADKSERANFNQKAPAQKAEFALQTQVGLKPLGANLSNYKSGKIVEELPPSPTKPAQRGLGALVRRAMPTVASGSSASAQRTQKPPTDLGREGSHAAKKSFHVADFLKFPSPVTLAQRGAQSGPNAPVEKVPFVLDGLNSAPQTNVNPSSVIQKSKVISKSESEKKDGFLAKSASQASVQPSSLTQKSGVPSKSDSEKKDNVIAKPASHANVQPSSLTQKSGVPSKSESEKKDHPAAKPAAQTEVKPGPLTQKCGFNFLQGKSSHAAKSDPREAIFEARPPVERPGLNFLGGNASKAAKSDPREAIFDRRPPVERPGLNSLLSKENHAKKPDPQANFKPNPSTQVPGFNFVRGKDSHAARPLPLASFKSNSPGSTASFKPNGPGSKANLKDSHGAKPDSQANAISNPSTQVPVQASQPVPAGKESTAKKPDPQANIKPTPPTKASGFKSLWSRNTHAAKSDPPKALWEPPTQKPGVATIPKLGRKGSPAVKPGLPTQAFHGNKDSHAARPSNYMPPSVSTGPPSPKKPAQRDVQRDPSVAGRRAPLALPPPQLDAKAHSDRSGTPLAVRSAQTAPSHQVAANGNKSIFDKPAHKGALSGRVGLFGRKQPRSTAREDKAANFASLRPALAASSIQKKKPNNKFDHPTEDFQAGFTKGVHRPPVKGFGATLGEGVKREAALSEKDKGTISRMLRSTANYRVLDKQLTEQARVKREKNVKEQRTGFFPVPGPPRPNVKYAEDLAKKLDVKDRKEVAKRFNTPGRTKAFQSWQPMREAPKPVSASRASKVRVKQAPKPVPAPTPSKVKVRQAPKPVPAPTPSKLMVPKAPKAVKAPKFKAPKARKAPKPIKVKPPKARKAPKPVKNKPRKAPKVKAPKMKTKRR